MNKLIVISGPTASGKTGSSIKLAKYIKDVLKKEVAIVNFDSLLFYKEISIGTAKPTAEECENIPHYLINIESIAKPLNASDYIIEAEQIIDELHAKNIIPILVGGSAFYLRALLKGMYDSPKTDDEIKIQSEDLYQKEGIAPIIDFLMANDPEILNMLHENDHYRLMRAYQHFKNTGSKISEQKKLMDEQDPYDFSKLRVDWDLCHFYLDLPKDLHQKVINERTEKMIKVGLLEEVDQLLKKGFDPNLKPLQSIGYKETIDYLQGKYSSLNDCIERISISTRQLAKSQRTFFKKIHPKNEINSLTEFNRILEITSQFLTENR